MSEVGFVAERGDVFERRVREKWVEQGGRRLDVLVAGCGRGTGLPIGRRDIRVTGIDEDLPALRAVTEARTDLDDWALGDLRSVPLPPRSFDVVIVEFLLERIRHTEVVLDRILTALRPDGLLLIRMRDRRSAYGFCDRLIPGRLRRLLWRRFVGGSAPGPLPAIYEPLTARDGLRAFCLIRGLRIVDELYGTGGPALRGPLSRLAAPACRAVDRLSRGRLPATHDELTVVIRKPHHHFARLI